MPEQNVLFIILPIIALSVTLPLQILTVMHLFRRVENGQESLVWIMLIFLLGLIGVAIYFMMPVSRKPRLRDDVFGFLSGDDKGKVK